MVSDSEMRNVVCRATRIFEPCEVRRKGGLGVVLCCKFMFAGLVFTPSLAPHILFAGEALVSMLSYFHGDWQ